jgi:hypothetical protein
LQLDKLEVFLHQSIQRILQILMTKVQEQRLHNGKVRDMFYFIPCVRNMIVARQMDFVGKMIRGPPDRPSRNMITACCDHKRQVGRPQTTGKNFIVENLRLLFQDIPTVQINRHGSLHSWIHEASNEKYWCQLVDQLLHPATPVLERPADWGPLLSWQARRATNGPPPNGDTSDSNDETTADDEEEQLRTPPRPQALQQSNATETHYNPKRWLNDPAFCSMIGRSMSHLLKILGLGLGTSETEI